MKNFLLLILFVSNSVFAQLKAPAQYLVYINTPESTIKATVLSKAKYIKTTKEIIYYWYSQNAIHQTSGAYDGKVLSGAYSCFYLSNNLKEKGEFKNGCKTGKWMHWYPDGTLKEITNWSHGVKSGVHELYDEKGKLILRSEYKNNVLHGTQTIYAADTVKSKKEFIKGVEVVASPKTATDKDKKESSFFDKLKSIFKKKDATKTEKAQHASKSNQSKSDTTPKPVTKKTLKERINALFKKKEKTAAKESSPKKDTSSKPSANK